MNDVEHRSFTKKQLGIFESMMDFFQDSTAVCKFYNELRLEIHEAFLYKAESLEGFINRQHGTPKPTNVVYSGLDSVSFEVSFINVKDSNSYDEYWGDNDCVDIPVKALYDRSCYIEEQVALQLEIVANHIKSMAIRKAEQKKHVEERDLKEFKRLQKKFDNE